MPGILPKHCVCMKFLILNTVLDRMISLILQMRKVRLRKVK